jgi:Tfp pilus assembly protein PilP
MKRVRLPEFIEVLVPTRDRSQRALSPAKQREWKERLARYLLETLKVTGFRSRRERVSGVSSERTCGSTTPRPIASTS